MQVPKLASAAEYFFKMGVEGKRFRPTVGANDVDMMFCSMLADAFLYVLLFSHPVLESGISFVY